VSPAVYHES
jgi:hypothetical protein